MKPISAQITVPVQYKYEDRGSSLLILLHGFQQTHETMWDAFEPFFPEDHAILSLAGPFLVPVQKEDKYEKGYSWYFFDTKDQKFLVDMSPAIEYVGSALETLGLVDRNKTVIGYSQGGYFAPFLSKQLKFVQSVGLISARVRLDGVTTPFPFPIFCTHGERDTIVDYALSKESYERLSNMGQKGDFKGVDGLGHRLRSELIQPMMGMISKA
ncbi:MAG: hypothetical protein KDD25_06565 [Bdellovibrionales bacterium]|nr:hypothetical protein [Bdellovibrionales bacterium]